MKEDLLIKLKISPNASKNEIIKSDNGEIKIKITAQPIENKANKCLIEFLAKTFKIPKTSIEIVKGDTSKQKTVLFRNLSEEKKFAIQNSLTDL